MTEADFADWYAHERPRVLAALGALSGRWDVAAEATDEAFARWDRVSAMDAPGGWTYRVALNVLRRALRREARGRAVASTTTGVVDPEEPDAQLWALVRALRERQRVAVVLRYVADLTEPAVAVAMGVRRGTVASTLAAARARLAEQLQERTVQEADHD